MPLRKRKEPRLTKEQWERRAAKALRDVPPEQLDPAAADRDVWLRGVRAWQTATACTKSPKCVNESPGEPVRTPLARCDPPIMSPISARIAVSSSNCAAPQVAAISFTPEELKKRAELVLFEHDGKPCWSGQRPLGPHVTNVLNFRFAIFFRGSLPPPRTPLVPDRGRGWRRAPGLEIQDAHLLDASDRSVSRRAGNAAGYPASQERACVGERAA